MSQRIPHMRSGFFSVYGNSLDTGVFAVGLSALAEVLRSCFRSAAMYAFHDRGEAIPKVEDLIKAMRREVIHPDGAVAAMGAVFETVFEKHSLPIVGETPGVDPDWMRLVLEHYQNGVLPLVEREQYNKYSEALLAVLTTGWTIPQVLQDMQSWETLEGVDPTLDVTGVDRRSAMRAQEDDGDDGDMDVDVDDNNHDEEDEDEDDGDESGSTDMGPEDCQPTQCTQNGGRPCDFCLSLDKSLVTWPERSPANNIQQYMYHLVEQLEELLLIVTGELAEDDSDQLEDEIELQRQQHQMHQQQEQQKQQEREEQLRAAMQQALGQYECPTSNA